MSTQDLIAGYAAYTDAAELGVVAVDDAPAAAEAMSTLPGAPLPTTSTFPVLTIQAGC